MKRFAELIRSLDQTTKTNSKVAVLADYFADAKPANAIWAIYFLSGRRLKRVVPVALLRTWASQAAGIPDWLLAECYDAVGDLAETISLVVPEGREERQNLNDKHEPPAIELTDFAGRFLPELAKADSDLQQRMIRSLWSRSDVSTRFVMMKLITGAFRVGVSAKLVAKGLSRRTGIPADVIAHRLMGYWPVDAGFYLHLIDPDTNDAAISRPYPFCLAYALDPDAGPESLIDCDQYVAEWKWDGIRGQVIRRAGHSFLWSRGEELMENRWPEIEAAADCLPDGTVLDGEILASTGPGEVLPFAQLQRRIGRKRVGKKLRREVPVVFHAFDILEYGGEDLRDLALDDRRRHLESLVSGIDHANLAVTRRLHFDSWDELAGLHQSSRDHHSEGLMLKRRDGKYPVGRVRGTWWKWKVAPYTIDAVMIYAQQGHGRRAGLFTDYTFAVWSGGELVPVAKAYSGLTDLEIRRVDRFVRKNTVEKFGPVRSVLPELVMELAFEGIQKSTRHKSGIATRFPRILRWRQDKRPQDANQLAELLELLPSD